MRYALLLLLIVSAAAFAQDAGYSAEEQQLDAAVTQLNARAFYLETGMTPGDWNKLTDAQKEQFAAKLHCKQARYRIDEQLTLEHAGHVGFYNWQSLRQIEKRDCGSMAYRLHESPNDKLPDEAAAANSEMMRATHGRPPPNYPIQALREGHQGTVMVEARITGDGLVTSARVVQSSGFRELDHAAVASAYKWHLDPAGGSVQTWPVKFALNH